MSSSNGQLVNYHLLEVVIELTNLMQTISFSSNYAVYALLNVQFRHALQDVLCCRLMPAATTARGDTTAHAARDHALVPVDTHDADPGRWRRQSALTERQLRHVDFKTTVHLTTSV